MAIPADVDVFLKAPSRVEGWCGRGSRQVDILVTRKSGGLGDIICCEPVIRGLRKKYPHAKIIFGMPHEFISLFEGRSEVEYKGYSPAQFTVHWMKKYVEQYDILLDLRGPETKDEEHGSPPCSRTESFCNHAGLQASCPQIHLTEDEKQTASDELNQYPKPWVGFGPNGTNWTRNWPKDRWEKLIAETQGTKLYFDKEKESTFDGTIPFVGKSLREIAALISQLDLMISVDTGLLHLAGAIGTRTFSIWGPSDPKRTLKHYPEAYYLDPAPNRAKAGCDRPCLYNPLACLDRARSFAKCMESIEADDVIAAVSDILSGGSEPGSIKAESYETKMELPEKGERTRIVWVGKHLLPMIGGAERTAVELLKHIAGEGYDVMAFWSHHKGGSFKHYSTEEQDGILWAQTPPGVLASKMLEAEPDIILTQLSAASHIAKAVPKTIPLVLFLHSVQEHFCERINSGPCPDGSPIDLLGCSGCNDESFLAMQDVYRAADEVIANSEIMARIFKKFTGRDATIQYPVVDGTCCGKEKPAKKYCVAIGVTGKRGRSFLGQLARAMPKEKFLWVGTRGGAPPNVEIVSHSDDLTAILSGAFLNLTPHDCFQAFGRTPAEAGWAGVPTLTFDNGGLPEAVGEGGMILPKSVGAWRDAILSLRKNKAKWQKLSDAAREHAQSFNWDAIGEVLRKYNRNPSVSVPAEAAESVIEAPARPTICVEICMKNEKDMIGMCLDGLEWADQVVILDDGSTDGSVEIAMQYPKVTEIFSQPDKGNVRDEAEDRQKLLEMAQATGCDWILFHDADEKFEKAIRERIYEMVTDEDVNLWYFLQVNFWRSLTHYRVDEMWYKGWFGRLFRNLPGLKILNDHNEHCGGIPGNIPGAPVWPVDGKNKARKSDIRMLHYGFVDFNRTVKRAAQRWERDPYRIENGVPRGGYLFYERMIDERDLELREYEDHSVTDHLGSKQ